MTDITPELAQRMEALVRAIVETAQHAPAGHYVSLLPKTLTEARAIFAELPAPVDPDEEEARKLARSTGWMKDAINSHGSGAWLALQAIKRGRALEREGR